MKANIDAFHILARLCEIRDSVKQILDAHNIYYGAIDLRSSDDVFIDDIEDFLPTGFRFCFSSHNNELCIPFSVLEEINKLGNFTLTLKQSGTVSSKPLYLYMYLDYTDEQILTAEF